MFKFPFDDKLIQREQKLIRIILYKKFNNLLWFLGDFTAKLLEKMDFKTICDKAAQRQTRKNRMGKQGTLF